MEYLTTTASIPVANPRQLFLQKIGLAFDPFATPVAEHELYLDLHSPQSVNPEQPPFPKDSLFFSYFVPPSSLGANIIQILRQCQPAFIFGKPGMGKTTLRFHLEAECRWRPDKTLIVTYQPGETLPWPPTEETQWQQLAKALAIDLFIQVVEQFNPLNFSPDETQILALQQQVHLGDRSLLRLIDFILEEPQPNHRFGLGKYWHMVRRSAVRYVSAPAKLIELLQRLKSPLSETLLPSASGVEMLEAGFRAARLWGFDCVFLMIDGIDNQKNDIRDMKLLLKPLLDNMQTWQKQHIMLKLFLPDTLEEFIKNHLWKNPLPEMPFKAIIEWSQEELKELLVARFQAARSRRLNFEDLTGDDLPDDLDTLILQKTNNSPRQFISFINALINAHAERKPDDPFITADDWKRAQVYFVTNTAEPLPALSSASAVVQNK